MSVLDSDRYRDALAVWMLRPGELSAEERETLEAGRAESRCPPGRYPLPTVREEIPAVGLTQYPGGG